MSKPLTPEGVEHIPSPSSTSLCCLCRVRPANPVSRPFPDRLKDFEADPSRWSPQSIHSEPATGVKTRGGLSEQIIYRNTETGETLVRHRVTDAKGRVRDDHFRPMYKPRICEVD
jgi:hypothetical protein